MGYTKSKGGFDVREAYKMALSLMVVLTMVMAAFFIVAPVRADNQATDTLDILDSNPPNVVFNDVAWNENLWNYSVAVGYNTNTGNGVVYKYAPGDGWTLALSIPNADFYSVAYDPTRTSSDHFFVVGEEAGKAAAYKLWDVEKDVNSISYEALNPTTNGVSATVFNDAVVDADGYLVVAGYDATNNVGVAAVCDYDSGNVWKSNNTGSYDYLVSVSTNTDYTSLMVGYHSYGSSYYAVAYTYSEDNNTLVAAPNVPGDAYSFNSITSPMEHAYAEGSNYFVIAGSKMDKTAYGAAWVAMPDGYNNYSFQPLKTDDATPPLFNDVSVYVNSDYGFGQDNIVIVGNHGTIYMGYYGDEYLTNWSDPAHTGDLNGVSMKAPHSPGYAIGVGTSSVYKVSYQVADTSTQIEVNTIYPHLHAIDFRNSAGTSVLNSQVDVGSSNDYYFYINASYKQGWQNVELDIYGWYDNGSEANGYNSTQGANLNFHLHYTPSSDPVNNQGTWTLVYPKTSEITLVDYQEYIDDDPNGVSPGTEDTQDYFHLYVNISFANQVRYAPGDGNWDASSNQSNAGDSFNDINSWNFNVTVYDSANKNANQAMYDEFGIYAYTAISSASNPSGSGPPGSNITLSPDSEVAVQSNLQYYVTVNVTDLTSASGNTIPRSNIYVRNSHVDNSSAPTDIENFTAFSGNGALWIWGNSSGPVYMDPMANGTYSAGLHYGYDTGTYTPITWKVWVPPVTPEDHFTATITYSISYPNP